ncbi:hypothetical protein K7X08_024885 [Anisodus acutangulus]|uniref:Uncharacterized protein n=1 Tax=Anisodus acutangulus TaxID=402998 RepID=A0A9Q1MCG7_9SOLA|nr:hypothetical protein K7X08_024885 [Anisodus acutangulus]
MDEIHLNDLFLVDLCVLNENGDSKFKECITCENNFCGLLEGANCLDVSKITPNMFVESTSCIERSSKDEERHLKNEGDTSDISSKLIDASFSVNFFTYSTPTYENKFWVEFVNVYRNKCKHDPFEALSNIYGRKCESTPFDEFTNLLDLFVKHSQERIYKEVRYLGASSWATKRLEVSLSSKSKNYLFE